MRIGIDISQAAYENTGVAKSVTRLIESLIRIDQENEYIFFFSSLRRRIPPKLFDVLIKSQNVRIKSFRIPQSLLSYLWNHLHILPLEWFLGNIDIFISSDWTEPPAKKIKKVTFIHDMSPFLFPDQTHQSIVRNQKTKLKWAKREERMFLCPSEATKKDVIKIMGIPSEKIKVIPWGVSL